MGEPFNHIQRDACRCGPPPEQCVAGEEVLAQFGWRDSRFRNEPRAGREVGLSMLRGGMSVDQVARYVLNATATDDRLKRACVRRATANRLRHAGFGVVHTPGPKDKGVHCTVSWPGSDPINGPQVPWPAGVTALFDSCFNEGTEAQTYEP
jgi:hypothetical protein